MIEQPWRKMWPFTCRKLEILTHGVWNDQNIGKEDGAIKAKTADWLQRDFGRCVGIVDESQESAFLGAQFPILGKIAASLSHEPHGPFVRIGSTQGIEKQTRHRVLFRSKQKKGIFI